MDSGSEASSFSLRYSLEKKMRIKAPRAEWPLRFQVGESADGATQQTQMVLAQNEPNEKSTSAQCTPCQHRIPFGRPALLVGELFQLFL